MLYDENLFHVRHVERFKSQDKQNEWIKFINSFQTSNPRFQKIHLSTLYF